MICRILELVVLVMVIVDILFRVFTSSFNKIVVALLQMSPKERRQSQRILEDISKVLQKYNRREQ